MSIRRQMNYLATVATLLGTLVVASPLYAQNAAMQPSAAGDSTTSTTAPAVNSGNSGDTAYGTTNMSGDEAQSPQGSSMSSQHMSGGKHAMMHHSPEDMKAHVEERIKTLHAKLKITPDEENAWSNVAQAMRDNEANMSDLIQQRHSSSNMTAVDDMQSYQKIAQAHADGLGKVAAAFSPLYNSMPDAQKANADRVFSGGGPMGAGGKHKGWHHHASSSSTAQ